MFFFTTRTSGMTQRRSYSLGVAAIIVVGLQFLHGAIAEDSNWKQPIILDRTGGFPIGGKTITNPKASNMTLSCDHGYMEYFIPQSPRETSLVMWHSSSTQVWQNRWDGGMDNFLFCFPLEDLVLTYPSFLMNSSSTLFRMIDAHLLFRRRRLQGHVSPPRLSCLPLGWAKSRAS